jgi:ubiquinone/menaquinone biosynthesis C-methylase UbiE
VATRRDYDSDPDRFRRGSKLTATYLRLGISLYDKIAGLLAERGAQLVLDLGCGEGALSAAVDHLSGQAKPLVVGLDASATMLSAAQGTAVCRRRRHHW